MKEIDYEKLGLQIAHYRKSGHLTQEQLAEKIHSSRDVISRIESGKKCSLDYFVMIANALNVSSDDLLCDSLECTESHSSSERRNFLSGCNFVERDIIIKTMATLKDALHANNVK